MTAYNLFPIIFSSCMQLQLPGEHQDSFSAGYHWGKNAASLLGEQFCSALSSCSRDLLSAYCVPCSRSA